METNAFWQTTLILSEKLLIRFCCVCKSVLNNVTEDFSGMSTHLSRAQTARGGRRVSNVVETVLHH